MAPAARSGPISRTAFTLIEAMVALSLTAMAGAAILLTVETSLDAADQTLEQTVAAGMADQLLDEIAGAMYCEPGADPQQYPLGPGSDESGRAQYDDIDDYHGYAAQPPEDSWGQPLGSEDDAGGLRPENFRAPAGGFDRWRQSVEVYYVDPNNLSVRLPAGQTSYYRAVEVTISVQMPEGEYRELTQRRRIFAYLPSAS
jgi:type II secretory pathway pseudopilin PulG